MKTKTVLFWFFTFGLLGSATYVQARGIRNNNPSNIRHSNIVWNGQSENQTDASFVQFDSVEFGIRAMNKILITYSTKYNLNTVRGIINRWAPPIENDTDSYVNAVANRLGVDPDEIIDVKAYAVQLTQAIIKHENGLQPYSLATINTGVQMAWA